MTNFNPYKKCILKGVDVDVSFQLSGSPVGVNNSDQPGNSIDRIVGNGTGSG
ncbi:hypothetical protein [Microcoleus sp. D2_18a_D3]|uniref:hypothetical protein n=1 Tax=Microcoleus sp. D2_18a_D3 TaxID=3055330 RepID=UPI002FD166E9